jgi:hypothetical protein
MDTLHVLYKPVRLNIWRCLERANKIIQDGYEEEDRAIIGWPDLAAWNAMLNATPKLVSVTPLKSASPAAAINEIQHV